MDISKEQVKCAECHEILTEHFHSGFCTKCHDGLIANPHKLMQYYRAYQVSREIKRQLSATNDIRESLSVLTDVAYRYYDFDRIVLYTSINKTSLRCFYASGLDEEKYVDAPDIELYTQYQENSVNDVLCRAYINQQTVIINEDDRKKDNGYLKYLTELNEGEHLEPRSAAFAMVPLSVLNQRIGVLGLFKLRHSDRKYYPLMPGELSSIELIAMDVADNIDKIHYMEEVVDSYAEFTKYLTAFIEKDEPTSKEHAVRVANLARKIAIQMGLPSDTVRMIYTGALLHDLGKAEYRSLVLLPRPLTPEEKSELDKHTTAISEVLLHSQELKKVLPTVVYHHEKYDGSGYPIGLVGKEIPIGARILSIADVYDALLEKRPYKESMPLEKAVQKIKDGIGTHFDPEIVKVFLNIIMPVESVE